MVINETIALLEDRCNGKFDSLVVENAVIGIIYTGIKLSDGSSGVSYTPIAEMHESSCCMDRSVQKKGTKSFKGMSVNELLHMESTAPVLNAVKVAAMNALSSDFIAGGEYEKVYDKDALDLMLADSVQKICMVGAFKPFLKRLKQISGIELSVLERRREKLAHDEQKYYAAPDKAARFLSNADMVIITGSSIANGTIDSLLDHVRPDALSAVVGPSASFIPDALFSQKIKIMSGVLISDSRRMLEVVAEGGGTYHLFAAGARKINILRQ